MEDGRFGEALGDIERAKNAAEILGAKHAFTDYLELFPHVDACLVVTPHYLHH